VNRHVFWIDLISVVQRAHDLAHLQPFLILKSLFIFWFHLFNIDCFFGIHVFSHRIYESPKLVLQFLHVKFFLDF